MTQALARRSQDAAALASVASDDAALLELREPYERTLAAMDKVSPAHSRAEDAYFALKTECPDLDERECRKATGMIPAERAWLRATHANLKVIREITAQPARTLIGVLFKAEISDREGNADPDLMESIVTDLVAMGGRANASPATISADAVVAAVRASAAVAGDGDLLSFRDEWVALANQRDAAFDVLEFAQDPRFGSSEQHKLAAGRLADASMEALDDFVQRHIATPARTPRGIAFKIEIGRAFAGDREDITRAILADLSAPEVA